MAKDAKQVAIANLYISAEAVSRGIPCSLLERCLAFSGTLPHSFELNFSAGQRFGGVEHMLGGVDLADFANLSVFSEAGNELASVGPSLVRLDIRPGVLRLLTVSDGASLADAANLLGLISREMQLLYGYARLIRSDYDALTETRIKKSLFGSLSVEVRPEDEGWLIQPSEIHSGSARGLYPVNYLTDTAISRLAEMIDGFSSLEKGKENILLFSPEELQELKMRNSRYAASIHSSDTD